MDLNTEYQVVNIMFQESADDEYFEENVLTTSLSDDFTELIVKEGEGKYWFDQNLYIGKPRYFLMSLKTMLKQVWEKENIDLFCKNNPEVYGLEFNIWNPEPFNLNSSAYYDRVIKYIPTNG